ncbi:Sec-independent protein translocase protein TatB [Methylotenera sp.]|uniref:Sec-independent protein translocase protein TatB n=1 Tax=Methylotenera sp. TaxID=2051956 RepID=UPI00248A66DF|nr:Sec-independent protein translocase protein TatB [Methylotenera sp.]MDI1363005.1 Sec-independent protein translocase protein TatB [Methylotenera sp.]
MFDVSFSELIVIAVVALIVIGPEKLPKVARTLGALAGRMQRYVAQVKEEVNREVRFEELQQLQQEIQDTVTKTKESIQSSVQESIDAISKDVTEFKLEASNPKVPELISTDVNSTDVNSTDTKPKVKRTRTKKVPTTE